MSELRRKDLDLGAMTVRVERAVVWRKGQPGVGVPKSRAGVHTVALPPNLRPALTRHLKEHALPGEDGLPFPNAARTGHLHVNALSKTYHRARRVAGRPDLRVHDLRHSAATMATQAGATLAELMARMGHSTPKSALVYRHLAEGRDRIIAERLALLAATPGADVTRPPSRQLCDWLYPPPNQSHLGPATRADGGPVETTLTA